MRKLFRKNMPLPEEQLDTIKPEDLKSKLEKPALNTKILIFGIPIFMVQLVVVYFVTANILMKKFESSAQVKNPSTDSNITQVNPVNNVPSADYGKFIYSIDDIIVNPADTDGKRLLLTSVGLDVAKVEMENDIKTREPMVKDAIISTLSSKSIDQLDDSAYRDTMKTEIIGKLKKLIPSVAINNIYFSKYIIQ